MEAIKQISQAFGSQYFDPKYPENWDEMRMFYLLKVPR